VLQPDASIVPYRQPQLAAGHGLVVLTFAQDKTIYFCSSRDQGRTFSQPTRVAEAAALAAGRHRGPRAVILKDAILISAVVGEKVSTAAHAHGLPANGNLTVWRCVDQGKTWSRSGVINDVAGTAREGLQAFTADRNGNVLAAWLDLRDGHADLWVPIDRRRAHMVEECIDLHVTRWHCVLVLRSIDRDGRFWSSQRAKSEPGHGR
jgi:hypothetical protein